MQRKKCLNCLFCTWPETPLGPHGSFGFTLICRFTPGKLFLFWFRGSENDLKSVWFYCKSKLYLLERWSSAFRPLSGPHEPSLVANVINFQVSMRFDLVPAVHSALTSSCCNVYTLTFASYVIHWCARFILLISVVLETDILQPGLNGNCVLLLTFHFIYTDNEMIIYLFKPFANLALM